MNILEYLSVSDLHAAEKVSLDWSQAVFNGKLWEKHFKRNVSYFVKSLLLHFEKQYFKNDFNLIDIPVSSMEENV